MSSWCSCAPPSLGVCSVCAVPCFFVSFKLSHFSCNGNRNKNKAVNLENKTASLLPFHLNFSVPAVVSGTQHSLYNAAWYQRAGTGQCSSAGFGHVWMVMAGCCTRDQRSSAMLQGKVHERVIERAWEPQLQVVKRIRVRLRITI